MELFTDVVFLSRLQFALCVAFHFLFVPMSIGLGLILAVSETRYYKTRDPKDAAAAHFWTKIFTVTFAVGVATGASMPLIIRKVLLLNKGRLCDERCL